ncbi:hypothetical protein PAHAL_1G159700 [Panicum hallii]|uniref:Uncharacterized protein n=1 Tax=Panicum hallii TaxID=206008 RepID=A0A2T8KVE8_9POAL|nr:hypothetical protein PAHAL_1G159700 [Panicum hallii]
MSAQPPVGPSRLAAAPVRHSRSHKINEPSWLLVLHRAASGPSASTRTEARPHWGRALHGRLRQAISARGLAAPWAGPPRAAAPQLLPRTRACTLQRRQPRAPLQRRLRAPPCTPSPVLRPLGHLAGSAPGHLLVLHARGLAAPVRDHAKPLRRGSSRARAPARRRRSPTGEEALGAAAACPGKEAPGATSPAQARRTARIHAGLKRRGREAGQAPQEEAPPVEQKKSTRERKNRGEGEIGFSQGLVRKFRKLQGPLGKVKFLINLKT